MSVQDDATGDVQVHLLDGGSLSTATLNLLHAEADPERFRMYNWCFLIEHKRLRRRVLWDLGCSHVSRYRRTSLVLLINMAQTQTLHRMLSDHVDDE